MNLNDIRSVYDIPEEFNNASNIVLVGMYDEPSLMTGEYLYDKDTDTLYVGAGLVMDKDDTPPFWWLKHSTSVRYIPSPRIRSEVIVELPNIGHSTGIRHITPPRIRVDHVVNLPNITHSSRVRKANVFTYEYTHIVNLPTIEHETIITPPTPPTPVVDFPLVPPVLITPLDYEYFYVFRNFNYLSGNLETAYIYSYSPKYSGSSAYVLKYIGNNGNTFANFIDEAFVIGNGSYNALVDYFVERGAIFKGVFDKNTVTRKE